MESSITKKDRLHHRLMTILDEWGMMEANLTSHACRLRITNEILEEVEKQEIK